jgi:hypothetical protein
MINGQTYYFCTAHCKAQFEREPGNTLCGDQAFTSGQNVGAQAAYSPHLFISNARPVHFSVS